MRKELRLAEAYLQQAKSQLEDAPMARTEFNWRCRVDTACGYIDEACDILEVGLLHHRRQMEMSETFNPLTLSGQMSEWL